jgi:hypothetical protein
VLFRKNVKFENLFPTQGYNSVPFTLAHLFYRSVHSTVPRNGAICLDKVVGSRPYMNQDTPPARFIFRSFTLAHLFYRSVHSSVPRNGPICLDKVESSQPYTNHDSPPTRFDWRFRAPSRVKNGVKKDEKREISGYIKRLRPDISMHDTQHFHNAIQHYSMKYVVFLLYPGPFFIDLSFLLDFQDLLLSKRQRTRLHFDTVSRLGALQD